MKIPKNKLEVIIKEELEGLLNEISPKTQFDPGGFKGIMNMAKQAEWALDNLEMKFEGEAPQEIYTIQRFIESIKKASMWQLAANTAPTALSGKLGDPYASDAAKAKVASDLTKQVRRAHTPAYKRDEK